MTASLPDVVADGPWRTAWRKLRRDRAAIVALFLLAIIILACLAAPLYVRHLSGVDPFASNLSGQIEIDGQSIDIIQPETEGLGLGTTPIGPTLRGAYFLGADGQGRDVAARLLYGGRNSLLIAGASTVICLTVAAIVGMVAGYLGGWTDTILARLLDIMWAFPINLLAISLSIVFISQGIHLGPVTIESDSLILPILIIAIVYVPYVARAIRAQVLTLRRADYITAAIGLGVPHARILLRDVLPNVVGTVIVFAPLLMALNMLTEAALSFLSVGVQPPDASWGTIISDGQDLLYTRPFVAVAGGSAIAITVVALNVLGDGLRDALDPRAKLRTR